MNKVMAETTKKPALDEKELINGAPNAEAATEVNKDAASNKQLIVVNKARPDILVDKARVNRLKVTLKGINAVIKDKVEGEQIPDTFMFNTNELIWGITRELDSTTRFNKNATSFPASSWGVLPTLRADMLLSNIVDYWQSLLSMSSERFAEAYGHSMDGVHLDILQIYVPAGVEFVNPYGRDNVGKVYDTDYVFTFITGFHYDINDFNQLAFIRDVYNGSPKEVVDDNGVISVICQTTNIKKKLPPKIFGKSLVKCGYFGDISDEEFNDLIETLSY